METSIIHNRKVTVMKRLLLLLGIVYAFFALPMYSQDVTEFDDIDNSLSTNLEVATNLTVTIQGAGSVRFSEPSSNVVSSTGNTVTVQIPINSRVPGQGPILRFTVNKDAKVSTSDKQSFNLQANELCFILLANQYYPHIVFHF